MKNVVFKFQKIYVFNYTIHTRIANYLNFVFHKEVKAKSNYKFFNYSFSTYQKHEMTFWVHGFSYSLFIFIKNGNRNIVRLLLFIFMKEIKNQ